MNSTALKALVAFLPICTLFLASAIMLARERRLSSLLQLVGAAGLVIVVVTHVCEALHLFPSTRWGQPNSSGHYLDLTSAILGLTLFPLGYVLHALRRRIV